MINHEKLTDAIREFIDEHEIINADQIYINQHVSEMALEFVQELCEIVGYADPPEDAEPSDEEDEFY